MCCALVAAALAAAPACGSNESPTAPTTASPAAATPTPSPTSTAHGSASFKVDGAPITATSVTATFTAGILAIGAGSPAQNNTILSFALTPTGPGVYALGPLSSANALLLVGNPAAGWNAAVGIGSGSITLTSLSATGAAGTFSFTLNAATSSITPGTRTITDGIFNVTF